MAGSSHARPGGASRSAWERPELTDNVPAVASPYDIRLTRLEAKHLAVVKDVAYAQNIGSQIGANLHVVFAKLQELGVTGLGQSVVAHFPNAGGDWNSAPGIPIEVGVELAAPLLAESVPLVRSSIPECQAAGALHSGPYQGLPEAHMAIHAWCRENGHAMTGRNWEVYGEHHPDDPSKLRIHVYYELK
jgi:effector-binding domain-containing protein